MGTKRRKKGEGTIFQRADGLWCAQLNLGKDENGKRIRPSVVAASYEEVASWCDLQRARARLGGAINPTTVTLAGWLRSWLEFKKPKVRRTTFNFYYDASRRACSVAGGVRLTDMSTEKIRALFDLLRKKGYSDSSLAGTYTVLKQAFAAAVEQHIVLNNPVLFFSLPPVRSMETLSLTHAEEDRLLAYWLSRPSVYHDLFIFLVYTGLRLGEAIAFLPADLLLVDGRYYVDVNKTHQAVRNLDASEDEARTISYENEPKSKAGIRLQPLLPLALEAIHRRLNVVRPALAPVFCSRLGTHLQTRNIRRALSSSLKAVGITKRITPHSLRKTFSTRIYEADLPDVARARLLGHSSVMVTNKRYVTQDLARLSDSLGIVATPAVQRDT